VNRPETGELGDQLPAEFGVLLCAGVTGAAHHPVLDVGHAGGGKLDARQFCETCRSPPATPTPAPPCGTTELARICRFWRDSYTQAHPDRRGLPTPENRPRERGEVRSAGTDMTRTAVSGCARLQTNAHARSPLSSISAGERRFAEVIKCAPGAARTASKHSRTGRELLVSATVTVPCRRRRRSGGGAR
jgi:hypothetical protein